MPRNDPNSFLKPTRSSKQNQGSTDERTNELGKKLPPCSAHTEQTFAVGGVELIAEVPGMLNFGCDFEMSEKHMPHELCRNSAISVKYIADAVLLILLLLKI